MTNDVCFSTILAMILLRKLDACERKEEQQYDNMAQRLLELYENLEGNSGNVKELRESYEKETLLDFYK